MANVVSGFCALKQHTLIYYGPNNNFLSMTKIVKKLMIVWLRVIFNTLFSFNHVFYAMIYLQPTYHKTNSKCLFKSVLNAEAKWKNHILGSICDLPILQKCSLQSILKNCSVTSNPACAFDPLKIQGAPTTKHTFKSKMYYKWNSSLFI